MYPMIAVIDDEKDVVQGLCFLLDSVGYKTIAYHSADHFLADYTRHAFQVIIVDVLMQRMTGVELHQYLIEQNVTIPVIMITGHGDIPMAVGAMKAGAVDFLTKPVSNQHLLSAINKSIATYNDNLTKKNKSQAIHEKLELLTPREREIVELLKNGISTKEIALKLKISSNTVDVHRANILHKLNVDNTLRLLHLINGAT